MTATTTNDLRRLDAEIAKRVMGWYERVDYDFHPPQYDWFDKDEYQAHVNRPDQLQNLSPWSPSTDLTAAFQVVEKMRENGWSVVLYDFEGYWCAKLSPSAFSGRDRAFHAKAILLPEAICRAALAAVEGK